MSQHFKKKGFKIYTNVKIRGRTPDLLAIKNGKIIAVEIKAQSGNIEQGIQQSLHQKNAVNSSYLVIPKSRSDKKTVTTCQNLRIGLFLIDKKGLEEVVKPEINEKILDSTQDVFFKEKEQPETIETERQPLVKLFRSESEVIILKEIIQNPNELHANELARKTGLASSTIAKEMPILFEIGLVQRRKLRNLVLYKINTQCEIYNELRSIFQKFGGKKN